MAGVAGFEPAHGGIKSRCLTAWPHPNLIFGVFYSIICIKGERSKLFTKTNSGFLLRTSLAWSSLSNSINTVEPVPDSRGFPIDSNFLNKELQKERGIIFTSHINCDVDSKTLKID